MTRLYSAERDTYVLVGGRIGAGTQGAVFTLPEHRGRLVKLFHQNTRPKCFDFLFGVIRSVVRGIDGITPIHDLLHTVRGGPAVGYEMTYLTGGGELEGHDFGDRLDHRVDYALRTARIFLKLEERFAVVSDCHEKNLWAVGSPPRPMLIDVDSLSIADVLAWPDHSAPSVWSAPVHNACYTALERYKDPVHVPHSLLTQRHTVAAITYRILKDHNPMAVQTRQGAVIDEPDESIKKDLFGRFTPLPVGREAIDAGVPWKELFPDVRNLFDRAFHAGLTQPNLRPSVAEWVDALEMWQTWRRRDRRRFWLSAGVGVAAAAVTGAAIWLGGQFVGGQDRGKAEKRATPTPMQLWGPQQ